MNRLDQLGDNWLRYYRAVWAGSDKPMREDLTALTGKDRKAVLALLPGVRDTMQKMKQVLAGLEKSLQELERKPKG